jgi:hypothetical protein
VDVVFAPTTSGAHTDTIVFTGNIGMASQLVLNLTGNGQAAAGNLFCMPSSISFGTIPRGMTRSQMVTCTARGGVVQLSGATVSGDPMFTLPMPPNAMTLTDGQSATFSVVFNPQGNAMMQVMGTCTVDYSGTNGGASIQIPLSGEVQEPPPTTQAIAAVLTGDDMTADVDVHLIRSGGSPFDDLGGSDCFFADCTSLNYSVTWPAPTPGDLSYDPHLDRDPVFEVGDEHINLQNAEAGAYDIYVHYWGSTMPAGSDMHSCSVQVFVGGRMIGTYMQSMTCHQLWHVGTVNWTGTSGTFAPDTTMTTRMEGACL